MAEAAATKPCVADAAAEVDVAKGAAQEHNTPRMSKTNCSMSHSSHTISNHTSRRYFKPVPTGQYLYNLQQQQQYRHAPYQRYDSSPNDTSTALMSTAHAATSLS